MLSRLMERLSPDNRLLMTSSLPGLAGPSGDFVFSEKIHAASVLATPPHDVLVVDRAPDVASALVTLEREPVLGLCMHRTPAGSGDRRVAALQLAAESTAIVFRLSSMRGVPVVLARFLAERDSSVLYVRFLCTEQDMVLI